MQQSVVINGYKVYSMPILKQVANCKRDKKMPVEYGRLNIITVYHTSIFILFYLASLLSFIIFHIIFRYKRDCSVGLKSQQSYDSVKIIRIFIVLRYVVG